MNLPNIISKNLLLGIVISIFVFSFSIIISNTLYNPKDMIKRGYKVAITNQENNSSSVIKNSLSQDSSSQNQKEEIDITTMVSNADIKLGAIIFKKCAACHSVNKGGPNKIGPNLYGIVGRKQASISDFKYSDALYAKSGVWNIEEINKFITKPSQYASGTKMAFAGLKKDKDRANVIAYLKSLKE